MGIDADPLQPLDSVEDLHRLQVHSVGLRRNPVRDGQLESLLAPLPLQQADAVVDVGQQAFGEVGDARAHGRSCGAQHLAGHGSLLDVAVHEGEVLLGAARLWSRLELQLDTLGSSALQTGDQQPTLV